ncbi:MAG: hypothetical protein HON90_12470 [Halobacteriovoraceae bacterium]|jgi:endonuclease/exonuclease/phosphatase family metal-dependent hydrolase|nr:hypothetical protein [Halobacteriovoraceae bacterium]
MFLIKRISFFAVILFSSQVFASLKVATYNIKTFDAFKGNTNKVELKKILENVDADIFTVEEIINGKTFTSFIKTEFPGYSLFLSRCGGRGRQKIGFVYRNSKVKLDKVHEDNRLSDPGNITGEYGCGRLRPAVVGMFTEKKSKEKFVIVGLHLKAGGTARSYDQRSKQYKIVARIVRELKYADYKNVLLMGDLNSTGFISFDEDYNNFQDMLLDTNMETSSKNLKCTSYWSGMNRSDNIEESSVLDHVIFSENFLNYSQSKVQLHSHCKKARCQHVSAADLGISYNEVSDHCPVSITFK